MSNQKRKRYFLMVDYSWLMGYSRTHVRPHEIFLKYNRSNAFCNAVIENYSRLNSKKLPHHPILAGNGISVFPNLL
ncbi:MAG: hypothetical protein IJS08_09480, partial [Victivallales bacterium]|nr:hypothetical protein [Victivallales bacterium]